MKTVVCASREVPVIAETQVLVVGSGPAGIADEKNRISLDDLHRRKVN